MSRAIPLSPVGRETLHDKVYGELRRSLMNGMFDAGQMMRIQDLAETLQTSTMPVREALGRLVSEQALEALPNRTVRVPEVSLERLDDLQRARLLIEGALVEAATPLLTAQDITELKRLTERCETAFARRGANMAHATSELNHAFHFHIYRAAGSAVLIPVVESLWLQSGPYIRIAARIHTEEADISGTHHHWRVVAALEQRDAGAAVGALVDDITHSFDLIRRRIERSASEERTAKYG